MLKDLGVDIRKKKTKIEKAILEVWSRNSVDHESSDAVRLKQL